jgi:Flp pilus assembly pilin Flp
MPPHAMRTIAKSLTNEECGQDMVEYVLILAFVALAGAAAILGMSGDINTIWSIANSRLAAAGN